MASAIEIAQEELNKAVAEFKATQGANGTYADKTQRRRIVDAAQQVMRAVKDPADEWVDMSGQLAVIAVNRLFWDWGVFDKIPLEGSISYSDLAAAVDAEVALIARLGGVLVSMGVLNQTGTDLVSHTHRSLIFVEGADAGLVYQLSWDNGMVPWAQFPRYFEEYGRKEPQTLTHVPATFAYGHPELSYYDMLSLKPDMRKMFMKAMAPIEAKMPIAGIYNFDWLVEKARDPSTADLAVFVDVGGGKGHAIEAIWNEFPDLPLNRFILQDRPEVIAEVKALDEAGLREVQKMVVNFHEGQPVKGALVYWIRRCLHNYGDDVSINILRNVAEAMTEDSKLLLEEDVLDNPPNHMAAMLDLIMLGFGGKQRNLETWEKVISAAGLRISGISQGKGPWKSLSVIECVKGHA